jgi:hypothetical protein
MKREDFAAHIDLVRMIIQRLERLSADSAWARIASGYRRSMLKLLDRLESDVDLTIEDQEQMAFTIDKGLELLTNAAREMGDPSINAGLPHHR